MLESTQAKVFAKKFNDYLDNLGMPVEQRRRAMLLSKILHLSRHATSMLLNGFQLPNHDVQQQLKKELDWEHQSSW